MAHVLDEAEDRDLEFFEHGDRAADVLEGHFLRRAHHDGPGEGDELHHREGDIAGSGGHVDHHVVELAPLGLGGEVANEGVLQATAPDHRLTVGNHQPEAHQLDAVGLDGNDLAALGHQGLADGPQHPGGVRAEGIGVENPDLGPEAA